VSVLPVAWFLFRILPENTMGDIAKLMILPILSLIVFVVLVRRFDVSAAEDCGRLVEGVRRRLQRRPSTTMGSVGGPR